MDPATVQQRSDQILDGIASVVVSERSTLKTVLVGLLSDGHILLEDVPGTGKTLTARSFATRSTSTFSFSRVQFTPTCYRLTSSARTSSSSRKKHRASSSSRARVRERRARGRDQPSPAEDPGGAPRGDGWRARSPSTARPIPPRPVRRHRHAEPRRDGGDLRTPGRPERPIHRQDQPRLPRPSRRARTDRPPRGPPGLLSPSVRTVCSLDTLTQLRRAPESIRVEDGVRQYLVDVARATRTDERVNTGVSPRGIQRFFEVVRTHAALMGRSYATPDDVKAMAPPALSHRIVVTPTRASRASRRRRSSTIFSRRYRCRSCGPERYDCTPIVPGRPANRRARTIDWSRGPEPRCRR